MRGTLLHGTTRVSTRARRRVLTPFPGVALGLTALALLAGCTAPAAETAPVFATSADDADQAVTAACWRVANAMTLATNAQQGLAEGRWLAAEADGAYRAAARILDYIPVPSSSSVSLPLIALQELVDAPGSTAPGHGLDPADLVWQSTVERVLSSCAAEGVAVTIDEWTP